MTFNPKWLEGKTVDYVDLNRFPTGRARKIAHSPRIWFTDGSSIYFQTEETESGEYGTQIFYTRKVK